MILSTVENDEATDLHVRARACFTAQNNIIPFGLPCCKTCQKVFVDQTVANSIVKQAYLIRKSAVLGKYARSSFVCISSLR